MDEAVHYPPVYFDNQYEEEHENKNTCDKGKNGSGNLLSMRVQGQW